MKHNDQKISLQSITILKSLATYTVDSILPSVSDCLPDKK